MGLRTYQPGVGLNTVPEDFYSFFIQDKPAGPSADAHMVLSGGIVLSTLALFDHSSGLDVGLAWFLGQ